MDEKSAPRALANGNQDQVNGAPKNQITPPSLSLPKGGGAIRGMGEKFASNPVSGTGSMSVPIATSPGRSGFGPQLSLSYDSGAGNGVFAFGWNLSSPSITRKTDKGLPRYRDADNLDEFILSGAEDLVPVSVESNGQWQGEVLPQRTVGGKSYSIHRYRPRIEGLFARIERWTSQSDPQDVFWRSISKDNITTWYGKTTESRIADPANPSHVFSWLICESHDDKGNAIVYEYKKENSDGIDLAQAHERNRTENTRTAQRYLKHIKYGNRTPYFPILAPNEPPTPQPSEWLFEVVLDYGEHDLNKPVPDDSSNSWPVRRDPFSTYRAGFEVRTYRLCQRVLMFHHFPEELESPDYLARSTDFTYSYEQEPADPRNPIFSFLQSAAHCGYKRQADGSYLKKSLPPLEFEYTQPIVSEEIHEADPESLENLPYGLDNGPYQWVDLDGEGLSGVLTEQAEGWFYKRNLSPVYDNTEHGTETTAVRFGAIERVAETPSLAAVGRSQFLDLAGDGQLDLVELSGSTPGFYERSHDEGWASFTAFTSLPVLNWNNPNLKFVDLTGDGHADILISEDEAFCWYPSLAEAGFDSAERVRKALDEEQGPRLLFADGTQSIYTADFSGDGMTDLVRIRNGEVCYWPNLGYGRFGAKVTMDHAPWFDAQDVFDQSRIRLADIDGTGLTDIIYLGGDGVHLYFNESGNSWSAARHMTNFPAIDSLASVQAADLLGNGTACLLWSSPLPGAAENSLRYIDLMSGQKPHLLVKSVNNLGAETHLRYAPSTKFYLADKLAGRPWISKIPFPVHVVERVEIYDRISRNRFVTRYAYHHGYFDGIEREFRGFGLVEQWDTEEFAALSQSHEFPTGDNIDESSHVPPVLTKTWFHTGVYVGRDHVSNFFAGLLNADDPGEYYRESPNDEEAKKRLLDNTVLPAGLTLEEEREACRALKGAMLRQEVYALDGSTEKEAHPYVVTEQNFTIRMLQPEAGNKHAVFFTHAREALTYQYERNPEDPRIGHTITLEVDNLGNVLKSAAVGYGRRQPDTSISQIDQAKQAQLLFTYTENTFTNFIAEDDAYRTPLPAETRSYELTAFKPENNATRFSFEELTRNNFSLLTSAEEIPYEQRAASATKQKRLIEHVRTLYRPNDLGLTQNDALALLPLGRLESLALPGESYRLALTPGMIAKTFGGKVTDLMLEQEGCYVHSEGDPNWWIPSGRSFFSANTDDDPVTELAQARNHFFIVRRIRDPFYREDFRTESTVDYDVYDLLVTQTRDALDNIVTARNDYRVLQPSSLTDPNGNRSEAAFDTLGMVVGTAVMGKALPAPVEGDTLAGFNADLDEATLLRHLNSPLADPHAILQGATTRLVYDIFAYHRTKDQLEAGPAVAYALVRETHEADLAEGAQTKIQHSFTYSDGFGREIQKKIQAEAGPIIEGGEEVNPRWVGTGWTVFNNKGKPVRQFEPFFTVTHRFESDVRNGVSPILFYDPVGRVMATLNPNHAWQKVVFDPWHQESWDVTDTVLISNPTGDPDAGDFFRRLEEENYLPTWHQVRIGGALGIHEQTAAQKSELHANTPSVACMDSLGRTFLTVAHNKFERRRDGSVETVEEKYSTRVILDIEGNQSEVIDAKDRAVMHYDYDMLGNQIHSISMDAGERWMLNDVAGQPIRAWDARGHEFRTAYDQLHRPVGQFVRGTNLAQSDPRVLNCEFLFQKTEYGEDKSNDVALNLRTRVFKAYDNAGVVTSVGTNPLTNTDEAYDFKGNLLRGTRQVAADYKGIPDWSGAVVLESQVFTSSTTYDALSRPISLVSSDNSEIKLTYNEANLLEQVVHARLRGVAEWTTFVTDIDYNAKGQRDLIEYGNGVQTTYDYDPLTFQLINLKTTRDSDGDLQNLSYIFDPAGNITHTKDAAQQTIFFANTQITPDAEYTYDAIYQLIEASGREHIGQIGQVDHNDPPIHPLPHPNNVEAMRQYTESYEYDAVGNILSMIHHANAGNWTRYYRYVADSNRLLATSRPGDDPDGPYADSYEYNLHGSMTRMPHLPLMAWDFAERLQASSAQVFNNGTTETMYYVYDASGQRVRKVTERQVADGGTPTRMKERIYLGGFEIYREYDGTGANVTLERETLHIMDDKQRIALVETKTVANQHPIPNPEYLIRYQLGNHLGSATLELDKTAQVISYEEYHPYGTTSYRATDSAIEVSPKRYRYTGKEKDEETGLYYHGARYYACWLGRWTNSDPHGIIDGPNLYAYVGNQPVSKVDPTGLSDCSAFVECGGTIQSQIDPTAPPFSTIPPANEGRQSTTIKAAPDDPVSRTAQRLLNQYPLPLDARPVPGTLSPQQEQAINDWHQQWLEFEIAVETNGLTPLQAMAADLRSGASGLAADLWSGASGLASDFWSAVISPAEAAEVRIYQLDSSANVVEQRNPTAAAQALRATTAEVLRSIERDPAMAVNQLTPGEVRRLATEPWRQHMLFGTAVERMVADAGRSRPDRLLLEHHQGNGPNDFSAVQQLAERGYDLTTFKGTSEHLRHRPQVQTVVAYRVANSVTSNFFQEAYSRNQLAELLAVTRDATASNYRLPAGVHLSMYLPMQIQRPPARPPVTPRR
jgi:RHS repeat-associated protein